jgi:uncharacterized protein (TIGR00369 family)
VTPDELLRTWIEEERAVLDRVDAGPGPGLASPQDVASKSGLEIMQAMLLGELPYAEMARTLTFGAISVSPGVAVFQGTPRKEHLNPMGTVHGGWISSVLDSALGSAVLTALPAGHAYTTAELTVKYVKGLTPRVGRVRAEARITEHRGRVAHAEAQLVGPDGTVYAKATTECRVFPAA